MKILQYIKIHLNNKCEQKYINWSTQTSTEISVPVLPFFRIFRTFMLSIVLIQSGFSKKNSGI